MQRWQASPFSCSFESIVCSNEMPLANYILPVTSTWKAGFVQCRLERQRAKQQLGVEIGRSVYMDILHLIIRIRFWLNLWCLVIWKVAYKTAVIPPSKTKWTKWSLFEWHWLSAGNCLISLVWTTYARRSQTPCLRRLVGFGLLGPKIRTHSKICWYRKDSIYSETLGQSTIVNKKNIKNLYQNLINKYYTPWTLLFTTRTELATRLPNEGFN